MIRRFGRLQNNTRPIPSLDFRLAQLEQALAHCTCMRHAQVWAEGEHALGEMDVTSLRAGRRNGLKQNKLAHSGRRCVPPRPVGYLTGSEATPPNAAASSHPSRRSAA